MISHGTQGQVYAQLICLPFSKSGSISVAFLIDFHKKKSILCFLIATFVDNLSPLNTTIIPTVYNIFREER